MPLPKTIIAISIFVVTINMSAATHHALGGMRYKCDERQLITAPDDIHNPQHRLLLFVKIIYRFRSSGGKFTYFGGKSIISFRFGWHAKCVRCCCPLLRCRTVVGDQHYVMAYGYGTEHSHEPNAIVSQQYTRLHHRLKRMRKWQSISEHNTFQKGSSTTWFASAQ